jgi:hypothetical protein
MNVGNVVYTVTDVGAHGWFDPQAGQNMGSGFVFGGGGNALFHAGLIVATAGDDVADACYGSDDNGVTTPFDFGSNIPVELGSTGQIDQYAHTTFSFPPSATPYVGGRYCIRQATYAWSSSPDNDYIILEFEITNTGDAGDVYVGWYADWDIGDATQNEVGYDAGRKLGYMTDASGGDTNFYGIAGLSHSLSGFRAVYNPTWVYPDGEFVGDPGFEDADKFDFLTGFGTTSSDVPDDWSALAGLGPFALGPGDVVRVAFLMVAGTSLADIQANTDAAQTNWNGGITQPIMSRQDAADMVTADIIDSLPEEDVLVGYGPLCMIPGGVDIHQEDLEDGRLVTTTTDLSWLFWLDLEPFSHFAHPTRFVVVNARSGTTSFNGEGSYWPTVGGTTLYRNSGDRSGSPDIFYVGATSPFSPGKSRRGDGLGIFEERRRAPSQLRDVLRERLEDSKWGLFVSTEDTTTNDWAQSDIDCAYDVLTTTALFKSRGPDIPEGNVTFMNNPTKQELCDQIDNLAQNCDKFYVYWTGHGEKDKLAMSGPDISGADFAAKLASLNAKEYCVIIDACHSESLLDDLADAGVNGFHMTSSEADSTCYTWDTGQGPFTGSWFSHFLWQCIESGLEGQAAFTWAEDTLKAYSDSLFAAHPEWDMGYTAPKAGQVITFTASGMEGTLTATAESCSTLCLDFRPDGSTTCGNCTVYCELDDGMGGTKWKTKKIWNWNLGKTRYLHAFGDDGATGKYKVTPHSNNYPVKVLVTWLRDTATPETDSSAPVFAAYSTGWYDAQPNEFGLKTVGDGIYFANFELGFELSEIPAFAGTPGTGFYQTVAIQYPLVVDPERPWIYQDNDPSQGYVEPVIVQMALADIFTGDFQPAQALQFQLEAWQGGQPVAGMFMEAVRTPDGIHVEPWPIPVPILPEPLQIFYTPIEAIPGSSAGSLQGAVLLLDALILDNPVGPTSSTEDPVPTLAFRLMPNSPNPFLERTTIRFAAPQAAEASLSVYDSRGRLVRRLMEGRIEAGVHAIDWDGRDQGGRHQAAGVYFYRLNVADGARSGKMILVR